MYSMVSLGCCVLAGLPGKELLPALQPVVPQPLRQKGQYNWQQGTQSVMMHLPSAESVFTAIQRMVICLSP